MPRIRKPDCGHTTLKVLVVIYNIFFWLVGATILSVGIYAEFEKRNYEAVSDVLLNPSTVLIVLGAFMFILTFIGCVGALRENILLLKIFGWTITIVFMLQLIAAIIAIVFKTKAKELVSSGFSSALENYYDDPDIHFAVDAVQQKLECCGGFDFNDWDKNIYFACQDPGSCGVPFSCCVSTKEDMVMNTQCGVNVREGDPHPFAVDDTIYIRGCTDALLVWFQDHLDIFIGLTLGVCLPQLIGCLLTWLFIGKIREAQDQYDYHQAPTSDKK
ncbi:tetraspanin-15 isoform X1 [Strongylocentrotus purpuratus]|uniref:Tetraspanin n=1 Tax=Strongylocentrotus purpuratus TaxID=7668 RepID=A0A7M7RE17_STRPU|nr:tetraspanin-15 isoform X1 [Strongylocentrotus purpuratus]|eukprot:XP_794304.3 PREDICTED: tetraspanin-15 isoform X1 [Strongylocentrotus purpuratus]